MAASTSLASSSLSLKELAKRESSLRLRYIELPAENESSDVFDVEDAKNLLTQSLQFLELTLISACFMEAANHLGITAGPGLIEHAEALLAETKAMSGLEVVQVIEEHAQGSSYPALVNVELPRFARVVDSVRATVAACPIRDLENLADHLEMQTIGHRCRMAHDNLRAFLVRNDPETQQRVRAVGHAYVQGAIGIGQASEMLGDSVPDVVASFETLGYARSIDTIQLTSERRNQLFSALRSERLQRGGAPTNDSRRAARHAIASERIELVDARPWIQHD